MAEIHEYTVAETCIACDACVNDFPEVFVMNDDHTLAIAKFPIESGRYDPWEVIGVCPVDAIALIKGTLPPKPEMPKKKEEQPQAPSASAEPVAAPRTEADQEEGTVQVGPVERPLTWEERWARAQNEEESTWERMKRYGQAAVIENSDGGMVIRFAMPEKIPDHRLKFMWGLPDRMPDYRYEVRLVDGKLVVKAWLEDPNVKKLCGIANSFPNKFYREIPLPFAPKAIHHTLQSKVMEISLEK